MGYLYKKSKMKRLIINEDEREKILSQHKKAITEQQPTFLQDPYLSPNYNAVADATRVELPNFNTFNNMIPKQETPTVQNTQDDLETKAKKCGYKSVEEYKKGSGGVAWKCPKTKGGKGFSSYIKQAQKLLGVPETGVFDEKTFEVAKTKIGGGTTTTSSSSTTTTTTVVQTTIDSTSV